jgi:hypothetical protein
MIYFFHTLLAAQEEELASSETTIPNSERNHAYSE